MIKANSEEPEESVLHDSKEVEKPKEDPKPEYSLD